MRDFCDLVKVNVDSLYRSGSMSIQCSSCVLINFKNFPDWCISIKSCYMLEFETISMFSYCSDVCGVQYNVNFIRNRV